MTDKNLDIGFSNINGWFRYRAAAIIIEDGCVMLIKNTVDPYYYSVGGAVHLNETAEDAVRREVLEETGIDYKIDRLVFIHENFFEGDFGMNVKKHRCHEIAFYFLMKPKGIKVEKKSESYGQGGAKEYVCWIPIKDLDKHVAYPTFFKGKLSDINKNKAVEHIVTHE